MCAESRETNTWTDKQRQVIEGNHHHMLVSAGAGSGKTAVLVERIISRVKNPEDPLSVDNILVVTFTEKAASEMRERIAKALKSELNEQPENNYLQRQLYLLNKAEISTLHSFCLDLLRHYFYYLDLDPGFTVASEYDSELLRQETMEELVELEYQQGEDEFYQLVDAYGGDKHDEKLVKMILTLHRFSRSHPEPGTWLKNMKDYFQVNHDEYISNTVYFSSIKRDVIISLTNCKESLEQAKQLCETPGGPHLYSELIEYELSEITKLLEYVEQLSPGCEWDSVSEKFSALKFARLPRISRNEEVDEDLKELGKEHRNQAKKDFEQMVTNYFSRTEKDLILDITTVSRTMVKLIDIVLKLNSNYSQVKNSRGIVDFSDLEHYVFRLLTDYPEITQELWQHFREVMVDEYQDINEVQNAILQALTGEESHHPDLFMVGDVKQSIYRFRLAEPELFLNKYNKYKTDEQKGQLVELQDNFRSSPFVLNSVNDFFKAIMSKDLTGLEYDESVELKSGGPSREKYQTAQDTEQNSFENREMIDGITEALLLDKDQDNPGEGDAEREARLIAKTIIDYVQNGLKIFDGDIDDYRELEYRDFVILGRKTKEQAEQVIDIFTEYGIPLYAELDTGYFAAQEVQIMLSLLKIIDNPRQDIPLAGVLRSPIIGLDSNDLMEIRSYSPWGEYYDAVITAQENLSDCELKVKISEFMEKLNRWRTISREKNLAELVWDIYHTTDLLAYVAGFPGGRERQANLWSFYDRALQFDSFTHSGLVKFLNFIDKLMEQDYDLGKARTVNENDNVVRMMSIHKSKGLEFPVVFIMGLGNNFNFNDQRGDLLLHKDLGLGPKLVDLKTRVKYPTIAHHAIKGMLNRETLAEEMRILYVAMTRAKEKLYLVGSDKNIKDKIGCYKNPANSQSYLDWVLPNLTDEVRIRYQVWQEVDQDNEISGVMDWEKYLLNMAAEMTEVEQPKEVEAKELTDELESAIDYVYPYQASTKLVGKSSVTELSKWRAPEDAKITSIYESSKANVSKRPDFMKQGSGLTGAEVGTSVHLVFQHIPVCLDLNEEMIADQLDKMVDKNLLSSEQRQVIWEQSICKFFDSDLGKKIRDFPQGLKRELPFTIGIPAHEIYEHLKGQCEEVKDEKIVVQGVIDYLFWDGCNYHLIDFKTDKLGNRDLQENLSNLKLKYQRQIELYLRAVFEIMQIKPKYAYIYHVPTAKWLHMMDSVE